MADKDGRLLADNELDKLPSITGFPPTITCLTGFFRDAKRQVAEAQDLKTASIIRAEQDKRIELLRSALEDTLVIFGIVASNMSPTAPELLTAVVSLREGGNPYKAERLDRPDREKIARTLMQQDNMNDDWFFDRRSNMVEAEETCQEYEAKADQLLALIPKDNIAELIDAYEGMLDGMGLGENNFKKSDWEWKEQVKSRFQERK